MPSFRTRTQTLLQLMKKIRPEMQMPKIPNIKPSTRPAFVEIIVIGCRDLQPYQFLNLQFPKCVPRHAHARHNR